MPCGLGPTISNPAPHAERLWSSFSASDLWIARSRFLRSRWCSCLHEWFWQYRTFCYCSACGDHWGYIIPPSSCNRCHHRQICCKNLHWTWTISWSLGCHLASRATYYFCIILFLLFNMTTCHFLLSLQVTKLPYLPAQCPLDIHLRSASVSELPGGRVQLKQLKVVENCRSLLQLLEVCSHRAFPVVSEEGRLLGLVRRSALEEYLQAEQNVLASMNLEEVADMAPFAVDLDFPVERAYLMFRELGLRHLVVTDAGRPVGILTRRSFLPSWWGQSLERLYL